MRIFDTRLDALDEALENSDPGDTITICRRSSGECSDDVCDMCAVVIVTPWTTVDDLIEAAKEFRA